MIVDHLVKLLDNFHMCLHRLLEFVQTLQDLLHSDAHVVDLLVMTITSDPDLVDFIVMRLEDSTDLLGNRRQLALQFILLWCVSACLHQKRDKMINKPCPPIACALCQEPVFMVF